MVKCYSITPKEFVEGKRHNYLICCDIVDKLVDLGEEDTLKEIILNLCAFDGKAQERVVDMYGDILEED